MSGGDWIGLIALWAIALQALIDIQKLLKTLIQHQQRQIDLLREISRDMPRK